MRPVDLLPELKAWNNGRGILPLDHVFSLARSDVTTAYIDLFWPEFIIFEEHVFRADFDIEHVRGWQRREGIARRNVEAAVNYLDIGSLFQNSVEENSDLLDARLRLIASTLVETYTAKLNRDFPARSFQVGLLDDHDDFALVFYQS